jgi:DNA-binding transcriptional LysR family regulator
MYLDLIASACNQADFTPQIAPEAPRILSTLNLVAAGLGVTLTPESLQSLHMDVIAYRSVPSDPLLTAPLNLECRNADHSTAARQFVAMAGQGAHSIQQDEGCQTE